MADIPTRRLISVRLETLVVGTDGDPRVVFLHGAGGAPPLYLALIREIVQTYRVQVWAPWLPNHGRSENARKYVACRLEVALWARANGLVGVPWVGHSVGAYIALELATTSATHWYRELVSHVVAVAPPIGPQFRRRPIRWLPWRLAYAYLEGAVYAALAFFQAARTSQLRPFLGAWLGTLWPLVRFRKLLTVIQTSPDSHQTIAKFLHDAITTSRPSPHQMLFGRYDLAVRPWTSLPKDSFTVLGWAGHNFPLLPGTHAFRCIVAALRTSQSLPGRATPPP